MRQIDVLNPFCFHFLDIFCNPFQMLQSEAIELGKAIQTIKLLSSKPNVKEILQRELPDLFSNESDENISDTEEEEDDDAEESDEHEQEGNEEIELEEKESEEDDEDMDLEAESEEEDEDDKPIGTYAGQKHNYDVWHAKESPGTFSIFRGKKGCLFEEILTDEQLTKVQFHGTKGKELYENYLHSKARGTEGESQDSLDKIKITFGKKPDYKFTVGQVVRIDNEGKGTITDRYATCPKTKEWRDKNPDKPRHGSVNKPWYLVESEDGRTTRCVPEYYFNATEGKVESKANAAVTPPEEKQYKEVTFGVNYHDAFKGLEGSFVGASLVDSGRVLFQNGDFMTETEKIDPDQVKFNAADDNAEHVGDLKIGEGNTFSCFENDQGQTFAWVTTAAGDFAAYLPPDLINYIHLKDSLN
jgi:hypothetical protein